MRTLVVVAVAEPIELALLLREVFGGRPGGFSFQVLVHALVLAVLLRARGSDPLVHDPELHPPDVELAQTVDAGRRERGSVVGADRLGNTVLAEQLLEGWLSRLLTIDRESSFLRLQR